LDPVAGQPERLFFRGDLAALLQVPQGHGKDLLARPIRHSDRCPEFLS
jgi:hypothetical protein